MAVEVTKVSDTVRVFLGLALLPDSVRPCTPFLSEAQCLALSQDLSGLCAKSAPGLLGDAGMEVEEASQVVSSQLPCSLSVSPSTLTSAGRERLESEERSRTDQGRQSQGSGVLL